MTDYNKYSSLAKDVYNKKDNIVSLNKQIELYKEKKNER
jgi:hypothetical protein